MADHKFRIHVCVWERVSDSTLNVSPFDKFDSVTKKSNKTSIMRPENWFTAFNSRANGLFSAIETFNNSLFVHKIYSAILCVWVRVRVCVRNEEFSFHDYYYSSGQVSQLSPSLWLLSCMCVCAESAFALLTGTALKRLYFGFAFVSHHGCCCTLDFRSINSEYFLGLLHEYKNPLFAMFQKGFAQKCVFSARFMPSHSEDMKNKQMISDFDANIDVAAAVICLLCKNSFPKKEERKPD